MVKPHHPKSRVENTSRKVKKNICSVDDLISKVKTCIDNCNYKQAQTHCQDALKREPDNLNVLEISATLCIELGNLDGARQCLGRSITIAPESGFNKYLSLGQLLEGKNALDLYLKGIQLLVEDLEKKAKLKKELEKKLSENKVKRKSKKLLANDRDEYNTLVRKLSNAYCAVAEIYMSDLCDEEEAETESKSNIQQAIEADTTNPEAYQHFANFLLIKEEYEDARENIKKSVSLWLPKYKEIDEGIAGASGGFDPFDICPLSPSCRFQTTTILIELEEYELASDVLEGLIAEDDQVVYAWYLLGWNNYLQDDKNKFAAKEHFLKALEVHKTCPTSDKGIVKHMKDLLVELKDVKEEIADDDEDLEAELLKELSDKEEGDSDSEWTDDSEFSDSEEVVAEANEEVEKLQNEISAMDVS